MAIKCPNCGQVLPKDNAKFCNSCGTALRPLAQNSQQDATPPPGQAQGTVPTGFPARPSPYEQIAQQPPTGLPGANRSLPTEPPSWMRTLDRGERSRNLPQQDEATQRVPYSRNRELHAKEDDESEYLSHRQELPAFLEEDIISPDQSPVFGDHVENLPTAQIEAATPKPPVQKSPGMQRTRDFNDAPQGSAWPQIPTSPAVWNSSPGDVAQLPTNRLTSKGQVRPGDPLRQPEGAQLRPRPMQPEGVIFQKPPLTPQLGAKELQDFPQAGGINQSPQVVGQAGVVPQSRAPMSMVSKPVSRPGMSRKRLALVLSLLAILVISGVAAWLIAAKPFAVASITQPWQQFCDSGLGVSGQYPTGWTKQVEASQGLHFSDGTDQFSIVTGAANGQDAGTYLRKEAAQLGITGLKSGTSASFAGTSWQQGQGSLVQTGVTYTETLFVTAHGSQLFTIMQIAPPGTYNEEDATIFSGMRSSLRFSNNCP